MKVLNLIQDKNPEDSDIAGQGKKPGSNRIEILDYARFLPL